MHKVLAALVALLVAAPAALADPPPVRGNSNTVVVTEREHGTFIAVDRTNPCTGADDLTVVFEGTSLTHVTARVVGGVTEEAHVIVLENGTFTTVIGGTAFTGRVAFYSRVIVNRQNSNVGFQEWIRATSPEGTELRFHIVRTVVFSAANATEPVVTQTHVKAVGCPAGAAAASAAQPANTNAQPQPATAPPAAQAKTRTESVRVKPRRRRA
jgi:hypothetical protein